MYSHVHSCNRCWPYDGFLHKCEHSSRTTCLATVQLGAQPSNTVRMLFWQTAAYNWQHMQQAQLPLARNSQLRVHRLTISFRISYTG